MARLAAVRESVSGFIFNLQWNRANFFDVVGGQFDIGTQLFRSFFSKLFVCVGKEDFLYFHGSIL